MQKELGNNRYIRFRVAVECYFDRSTLFNKSNSWHGTSTLDSFITYVIENSTCKTVGAQLWRNTAARGGGDKSSNAFKVQLAGRYISLLQDLLLLRKSQAAVAVETELSLVLTVRW
jgi:hypothetical protein